MLSPYRARKHIDNVIMILTVVTMVQLSKNIRGKSKNLVDNTKFGKILLVNCKFISDSDLC